jgi:hypothetical protein
MINKRKATLVMLGMLEMLVSQVLSGCGTLSSQHHIVNLNGEAL